MCQTRHAVILAAGESTRTRPLTLHRPKPLIPLVGQPLLSHILDELVGLVDHVTLVVGYRADAIRSWFGESYRGMRVYYVHQHEVNGTAGALLTVADQSQEAGLPPLDAPFFLLYGDNLVSQIDVVGVCQSQYGLAGLRVDDPSAFGVLDIVDGRVVRIIEKPPSAPPDALANPGIYHFDGAVFPALREVRPSPRGEYELTDLIAALAQQQHVGYVSCRGHWIPVGNPWDVLVASAFLLEQRSSLRPERHDSVFEERGCVVSGWVHLGRGVRLGEGCRILGPAFLGDGVEIGAGSVVNHSVLEAGVQVGPRCSIDHSVLLDGAQVEAGSTLQSSLLDDGAHVGAGCRLLAQVFDELRPVAATVGVLDREVLCRRGSVVGRNVSLAAGQELEPGTVLFPENG